MAGPQDARNASTNRRDAGAVVAKYAAWLPEQPLSARTSETYLAGVTAFTCWLDQREGGVGEALSSPRGRDLAARDYSVGRASVVAVDRSGGAAVAARAHLQLSAHTLRHTFVTGLVRAGNDLVLIAELAGHRRLQTTRRYSLPSEADRRKAVADLEIEF